MARWLVGLVLFSSVGFSAPTWAEKSVLELLSDRQNLSPQSLMLKIEKQYSGVICEFEIDVENGELIYEVSIIDTQRETITEFEFKAKDGHLINQKVETLEADDKDGLKAVNLMEDIGQSFYSLVHKAMDGRHGHILEAQIDHDLGISYLEIKLIDETGKHRLAFDIQNQRPLPLLTWD
ncbi:MULTISPECIES: PepSY domain-containing protein [Shewanella]|uniref:PepSY domain-containing protein n=2 Tax=Shewanella TaxID=22 RepID=B1KP02_SHEWM|nr:MULTISPECIES: hypothetical protein [Shewanella]ACA89033.1 conserved hypothetical protein [Shewanella woodyi ATCC 51908]MBW8185055.1 hypothetical protein [Shewanella nanhaiensis]